LINEHVNFDIKCYYATDKRVYSVVEQRV